MPGEPVARGEPDLAQEARFWREWNQAAFARAGVTPDTARIAAVERRAGTNTAILRGPAQVAGRELVQVHAAAGKFFQACLRGSWVPGYLADRGLGAVLLPSSPWKTGYAPATWTALTDHLRRQGYASEVLQASGLVATGRDGHLYDRFRYRLMIPLRDEDGLAIAFIGRRHPDQGDDHGPKYLNSPDTSLFVKGRVLAGLAEGRRALASGAQPVLVEGPMDAIAVSLAAPGQYTGVAPCGTSLTADQVALLSRVVDLSACGIRVALDGDTAGRKAAIRAYSLIQPVTGSITSVVFPDDQDPASILARDGRDALCETLNTSTRPLANLVVDARIVEWANGRDLELTEQQIGALRAAAETVATMPPAEVGPQATRLCELFTSRYGWTSAEVTREVINAVERRIESLPAAEPPELNARLLSDAKAPAADIPGPRPSDTPVRSSRTRPGFQASRERE
jgi:DNA primase